MSIYYNSVGEGWFKKNKVVNESKYSVDDLNITYREKDVNGMKKFEIELDEMDENSKEVISFLSKYLSKDDVYAAQDVIHDYIKGLKNKDVDEVYIAFESKEETVNEANDNDKIKKANDLLIEIKNNIINKITYKYLYKLTDTIEKLDKMSKIKNDDDVENLLHLARIIVDKTENGDIDFKIIENAGGKIVDLIHKTDMEQYLKYY